MKNQIIILGLVLIVANAYASSEEGYIKDLDALIAKSKESLQKAVSHSWSSIYAEYCTDDANTSFDLAKTAYALVLRKCTEDSPSGAASACWRNEYVSTSGRILKISKTALTCIMNFAERK